MDENADPGTCWIDTNTGAVFVYDGAQWLPVGAGAVNSAGQVTLKGPPPSHTHTLTFADMAKMIPKAAVPWRLGLVDETPSEEEIAQAIESIRRAG